MADGMKGSTAAWLVVGTAVVVVAAIFALEQMQPVVLRGVVVQKPLRNRRTVITLRHADSPQDLLRVEADAHGCFQIPTADIAAGAGELLLHVKRGRHRAMISPVGARAVTELAISLAGSGKQAKLTVVEADPQTKQAHPRCFEP
jgi:hypothetical protein